MNEGISAAYAAHQDVFEALKAAVEAAFEALDGHEHCRIHTISARLKAPSSLHGKLARPDKTYHRLTDITDLLGVRVITYFEDGVDEAARFVERRFEVDLRHSVDKRAQATLDRFGYRSLHYVCRPPKGFLDGFDAPELSGLRFEVQIRTILQHAWAEIEHDLGYKTSSAVPPPIRRRFSRLAGLLELVDEEFLAIKRDLGQYASELSEQLLEGGASVPIDRLSLSAFVDSPQVVEADAAVARVLGLPLDPEPFFPDYLVQMLALVGVDTIGALRERLEGQGDKILGFLGPYFAFSQRAWGLSTAQVGAVRRGYSLLFLSHMLLLEPDALDVELVDRVARFFTDLDGLEASEEARAIAIELIETARGG